MEKTMIEVFNNADEVQLRSFLAEKHDYEVGANIAADAIMKVAADNPIHPVREYLDGREWDGKPRLARLLPDYFGAADNLYTRTLGRLMLTGAVSRIYEPGTAFHYVVILEGAQGSGKTRGIKILAIKPDWYAELTGDLAGKDAVDLIQGRLIVEVAELYSLTKSSIDITKSFISRESDKVRLPYQKRTESFARQCIFIGTTNQKKYLRDSTGNRRFLPVKVGKTNFEMLEADRDQLWAEATMIYKMGLADLRLSPEVEKMAEAERSGREMFHAWREKIETWLADKDYDRISTAEIFADCLGFSEEQKTDANCKQLTNIMSSLAWDGPKDINFSGKTLKGYQKWG